MIRDKGLTLLFLSKITSFFIFSEELKKRFSRCIGVGFVEVKT